MNQNGKVVYDPLKLGLRIFNGVIVKCFFGIQQVNEKIKNESF